jgi:hypothetical protein
LQVWQGGEGTERKREMVFDLVAKSLVGRAASRITFHGVASIASPEVREALRSKFPARERPIKGQVVDNLGGLREALVGLELGSAPGVGGLWPEFLVTLRRVMGEEDMGMLEEHSMSFLNRAYPAWVYKAEGAINTISLFKTSLRHEAKIWPALLHHHGACLHPPKTFPGPASSCRQSSSRAWRCMGWRWDTRVTRVTGWRGMWRRSGLRWGGAAPSSRTTCSPSGRC